MSESATTPSDPAGTVAELRRYPVKSMLGESRPELEIGPTGVAGDRRFALLDVQTGHVATAKHPRLWRALLKCSSALRDGSTQITLPDGRVVGVDEASDALSALLGREVRVSDERPEGAEVERPDPMDVLDQGVEAEVDYKLLEIAQGAPGGAFVDYAPVHLITTATLDALGVEVLRYRPNIVIASPPDAPPFLENSWVGREFRVGGVRLRGILPTPRCSVPTLEHGDLPRAPQAVRPLLDRNRVDVPGFGVLPCAGVYAEVVVPGVVRTGDAVTAEVGEPVSGSR